MQQGNASNPLTTTLLYIIIGSLLLSFFVGMFPFFILLIVVSALIIGISFVYRYIKTRMNSPESPHSKYDEHGSRKIKSSVIEMKDIGGDGTETHERPKK